MHISLPLMIWGLSPLLSVLTIFLSLYLADLSLLDPASYKTVISGIYIAAITISIIACGEAGLLLLLTPQNRAGTAGPARNFALFLVNLVYVFALIAICAKFVQKSQLSTFTLIGSDVLQAYLFVALSTTIGVVFKFQLEAR